MLEKTLDNFVNLLVTSGQIGKVRSATLSTSGSISIEVEEDSGTIASLTYLRIITQKSDESENT